MPAVHLVRHGQASAHGDDYDVLSARGREQAAVVGAELARRGLRDPLVVSGTLARQRDTAAVVSEQLGLSGRGATDARWNEYDHLGLLQRYPAAEEGVLQELLDHALTSWIGDETDGGWRVFADGAFTALQELADGLGRGRDAVVVTSGGVLAAVCGALLDTPPAGIVALNRVTVNAAVTTLAVGRSGISLLTFNDHAHFAGERREMLTHR